MTQFQTRRQEQILADMIARIVARTTLSDVNDAASVKQVLAAAAREDDEQYYQMENLRSLFSIDTATGEDLDERAAEIQPATLTRIGARSATGTVVFSRAGTTGTTNIPVGTRVKTTDGIIFVTTAAGTITPTSPEQITGHGVGRDSAPVAVQAESPGADGNVVSSSIIKFDGKPAGIDEVTNLNPTLFGRDQETDDAFRQRLKDYIGALSRGTVEALELAAVGVEDETTGAVVLFSKAVEDIVDLGYVALYIDDGTGTAETTDTASGETVITAVGGETRANLDHYPVKDSLAVTITSSTRGALSSPTDYTLNPASGQLVFDPALTTGEVITASYTYFTGLIAAVQKVIDGDPTDRANFPGIRAAGVLVQVLTPSILIQTVTALVTVLSDYDQATVVAAVKEAVKTYINSLSISDDVIRNEIIAQIHSVDGVFDVDLTVPAANVIILDDQLARTSDPNLNIT